eukprot:gnl/TRDRNA2_/TRDRNA2_34866_c0_seq1.p1 gnl/TRDRNA2_/TRDRNA2_34866_c0~~gnl/TRDRNA2_/TRDRNA2_34866_c0_seq1.p1  ORF type:complete len:441 (+),score=62.53 gnl/TRDRNA2_/TRDRNA2_34866_c0_seq1:77-1399(+)
MTEFVVGDEVYVKSNTKNAWFSGQVVEAKPGWSVVVHYFVDGQQLGKELPHHCPEVCQRAYSPGQAVEYMNDMTNAWEATQVVNFDFNMGLHNLACKQGVGPGRIRPIARRRSFTTRREAMAHATAAAAAASRDVNVQPPETPRQLAPPPVAPREYSFLDRLSEQDVDNCLTAVQSDPELMGVLRSKPKLNYIAQRFRQSSQVQRQSYMKDDDWMSFVKQAMMKVDPRGGFSQGYAEQLQTYPLQRKAHHAPIPGVPTWLENLPDDEFEDVMNAMHRDPELMAILRSNPKLGQVAQELRANPSFSKLRHMQDPEVAGFVQYALKKLDPRGSFVTYYEETPDNFASRSFAGPAGQPPQPMGFDRPPMEPPPMPATYGAPPENGQRPSFRQPPMGPATDNGQPPRGNPYGQPGFYPSKGKGKGDSSDQFPGFFETGDNCSLM